MQLTTVISASAVSETGTIEVTVYDPAADTGATESAARTFHVVETLSRIYMPFINM
jgi:hypothetical protein